MTVLMEIYRRWVVKERLQRLRRQVAFVRQMEKDEQAAKKKAKTRLIGSRHATGAH